MKTLLGSIAVVLVATLLSPAFAAPPVAVTIEPYGNTYSTATRVTETLYYAKLGEPKFKSVTDASGAIDHGYALLVRLTGTQLANAVEYVQRADGTWRRVEFKVPDNPEQYDSWKELFEAAQRVTSVGESDLPDAIRRVPSDVRGMVEYVLVYHSGAVAFYFHDGRKAQVEQFAEALVEVPLK